MTTVTIPFNGGNPFAVGPTTIHSPSATMPATVTKATIQLANPNGDWTNPANAGGNFIYGIEYSPDSGTTWHVLVGNGIGQPVGSLNKDGSMPNVSVTRSTGITEAYGMLCRAFGSCSPQTVTIGASAIIET